MSIHHELVHATYRLLQVRAPLAYVALIRFRGADFYPVRRASQLVIAGAPGSANSYARAAFLRVNPDVTVASHAHVWTEVRDAARHGLPTLLLVRDPLGEAASRLTRFGNVTPRQALRDYATYYEKARRWREQVVLASFEQATAAFGDVTLALNAKFGTSFVAFPDGDPAMVAGLRRLLDSANGAIPKPEKAAERKAARAALMAPELAALRERCEAVYADLAEVVHRSASASFESPSAP